jgi:ABC-type dipeptide/oligopeptide/nickel transport system permease subunit
MGILVIITIAVLAIFADHVHTSDPKGFNRNFLEAPSGDHFFGTNRNGQDLWSRVVYGARPALILGLGAVGVAMFVATILALLRGFFGGLIDALLSRLVEILIAVPQILWLLMLTTAFDRSIQTLIFAIAFAFSPITLRVLRGNVIQEAAVPYVEAARVIGASSPRIMLRHILPNVAPLMIVIASITIPAALLAEAGLTFLGLGLEPGTASWAMDLGGGARAHFASGWWLPVFPGAALAVTVLSFNLLGDSLRDVLDPRLRGSGSGMI